MNCWHCSKTIGQFEYGRGDTCTQCGKDTRVCKNCDFYDPVAHNQCHENQADRVLEKEKSNFCDYFKPRTKSVSAQATSRDALKSAAEALFKKSPGK